MSHEVSEDVYWNVLDVLRDLVQAIDAATVSDAEVIKANEVARFSLSRTAWKVDKP